MSTQFNHSLKTYRAISHLLRRGSSDGKVCSMPVLMNISEHIRKHDVTDQRICRAPQELDYIAQCYKTYLASGEQYRLLYGKYYGKGEKSVEESAKAVGLKLPETKPAN